MTRILAELSCVQHNAHHDATKESSWAGYLVGNAAILDVATDGEAIVFDGQESGDLGRGELGWLRNVLDEVV